MSLPSSNTQYGFGAGAGAGLEALPDKIIGTVLGQNAVLRELIATLTVCVAELELRIVSQFDFPIRKVVLIMPFFQFHQKRPAINGHSLCYFWV